MDLIITGRVSERTGKISRHFGEVVTSTKTRCFTFFWRHSVDCNLNVTAKSCFPCYCSIQKCNQDKIYGSSDVNKRHKFSDKLLPADLIFCRHAAERARQCDEIDGLLALRERRAPNRRRIKSKLH